MGRAASSCLKIMACGRSRAATGGDDDEADAPVLPPAEAKSPQDNAKWSFLRSSKNQVSSNNIAVSGPLASVPEKDEDSEASNKGCSPQQQPEQAATASGKVRMMKFAEFVPKLSFHLTEPQLLDSLSAEKDNADDSTEEPHMKSSQSSEKLPEKDDDADGSTDTPKDDESTASAAVPACDAATTETGHSAKESVVIENDTAKNSDTSLHASEASTPARQSVDANHTLIRESAAIKIQTATRAHLTHIAWKKHNNATKLQAAVRGYLVRREAVGTLRCVQAILKMQALVRARRIHNNTEKLDRKEPLEALVHEAEGLVYMGKESPACGNHALDLLNEKLLKTGFILQLLESTPRSKCIYISCEPSRSDSAWRWLERWMTVISSDSMLQPEPNLGAGHHDPEEPVELNCSEEPSQTSAAVLHLPEIPLPCHPEPNIAVKENVDASDAIESHAATSTQGLINEAEEYIVDRDASDEVSEAGKSDADEPSFGKIETQSCGIDIEPAKETSDIEDSNNAHETLASQQKEPEASHSTSEFIEAPINELAAEHVEAKSLNVEESPSCLKKEPMFIQIPIPCSHSEAESLQEENADSHDPITHAPSDSHSEAESLQEENADSHDPITHAPSESESETSASSSSSSSSESPRSSESDAEEVACEKGIMDLEKNTAKNVFTDVGEHGEENPAKDNHSETVLNENVETVDENVRPSHSADGRAKSELSPQPAALDELDVHGNLGQSDEHEKPGLSMKPTTLGGRELNENGGHKRAYSSSPERSPSYHVIKASSFETPPSQISVNTENVDADDHANKKQGSSEPRSKRALSEMKHLSDSKPDQSVTDSKTTKKRHSIGSNNSLPSYMQATESAKAKVHASVSPKSSPDLKDSNRKKRLSLPAGTEKHNSSPRMQRSGSQVQQNPKANGVHAPLNFSERRWQR